MLIAGTHSSVGKTTVSLGLLAALRRRGLDTAPFKAGPDYIDPTLHAVAAGRPSRNLDAWLLSDEALLGVLQRGAQPGSLALIEGVMGLFDGIGASQEGSTAAVARTLACPVILVLDVAAMSTTAAAIVLGCQQMRPGVELAGVILNRVGSDGHARVTAEAIRTITGLPTLGWLPDDGRLHLPERHLGLVPATETAPADQMMDALATVVADRFDVDAITAIAESAPPLRGVNVERQRVADGVRVGVAHDRAFGFYYADTFDLLDQMGAEVVRFSPLDDAGLPMRLDAVYLGGGFPELYAEAIAANEGMRRDLQDAARRRVPIYGECGGLMALGQELITLDGERRRGFGLLPLVSRMTGDRIIIGYREIEALRDSALLARGERARGHEFHWSTADPPSPELAAYRVLDSAHLEGYAAGSVLGSYVHLNFAGQPQLLERFLRIARESRFLSAC